MRIGVHTRLQDISTDTPFMTTRLSQDLITFRSRFHLLQAVMGFLQEVLGFLQETSCRTFGLAKIDFGEEYECWNLFVRPAATPISTHHHMALYSISLHLRHPPGYVFLHNHTRNPVFFKLKARIFNENSSNKVSHTLPVQALFSYHAKKLQNAWKHKYIVLKFVFSLA